jgi:dUTP pyrophosphatase
MQLLIRRLDPGLDLPDRPFDSDAGLDLRARTDVTVSSVTSPVAVPTGVAVALPDGYVGYVCSRSGLARDRGIAVLNAPGIIDAGYRGEIVVVMYSLRPVAYTLRRGSRVAQLVVQQVAPLDVREVEELPRSARASHGFGASGER